MNKKSILGFLSGFVTYLLLSIVFDFFNIDFKALIVVVIIIITLVIVMWKKQERNKKLDNKKR